MTETKIRITALSNGKSPDPDFTEALRSDLARQVGEPVDGPADPGAKGVGLDLTTIVVSVIGSQAMVALVGVLKARFERDASLEVDVEGDGWKVRLKSADARRMSAVDIADLIDRATGGSAKP